MEEWILQRCQVVRGLYPRMCTGYVYEATSGSVGPAREEAAAGVRMITGAAPDKGDDEVLGLPPGTSDGVVYTSRRFYRAPGTRLQHCNPAVREVAPVGLDFDLGDECSEEVVGFALDLVAMIDHFDDSGGCRDSSSVDTFRLYLVIVVTFCSSIV